MKNYFLNTFERVGKSSKTKKKSFKSHLGLRNTIPKKLKQIILKVRAPCISYDQVSLKAACLRCNYVVPLISMRFSHK